MSDRASASFPSSCSGDMYCSVPRMVPATVRFLTSVGIAVTETGIGVSDSRSFAKPKSSSFAPFLVSITFAGRTYVRTDNHDPDGDSNGTTIKVNRP